MLLNSAASLIDRKGKDMTLRVTTAGAYSPATGQTTGASTADHSVKGLMLNYRDFQREGALIRAGDRKCVLKAKGMTAVPKPQDIIVDGAVTYKIVDVQQVEESGTDVIYTMQVRR